MRLERGPLRRVVGVAGEDLDVVPAWRRPAAPRSCRARPAVAPARRSAGGCGVPLLGMIVTYCPASSPKRAITRRIRSTLLRGSTPRWSPAWYDAPCGQGDLEVAGRPWRGAAVAGVDQLAVLPDLRRAGVVGHDHRVGHLPVGQRDREPGAGRCRPRRPRRAGPGPRPGRPRGRRARRGTAASKSPAALPSPRGCTRRAPCASSCASISVGTAW